MIIFWCRITDSDSDSGTLKEGVLNERLCEYPLVDNSNKTKRNNIMPNRHATQL